MKLKFHILNTNNYSDYNIKLKTSILLINKTQTNLITLFNF